MTEDERRLAQTALQSGNSKEARRILRSLVHLAPEDWTLWWQLALATDEVEQKITCLKQVLKLNPSHVESVRLLRQIERTIARPTPISGIRRPVHDTEQVVDMHSAKPVVQEGARSFARRPAKSTFVPVVVVVVVVGILVVIIGGAYIASIDVESSPRATDLPSRALSIQVDRCIVNGGELAQITFKNLTGDEIILSRGDLDAEVVLTRLDDGSESTLDVNPDEPIRYAVSVNEGPTNTGGATIAVPAGSSCAVVIR